jgi:hypothetical protein
MKNRLLFLSLILAAITAIGIGSFALTSEVKQSQSAPLTERKGIALDESLLRSRNDSELPSEITEWANRHFSGDAEVFGDFSSQEVGNGQEISNDIAIPHPPFTFERIVEFEVLAIPDDRRHPEMNEMRMPTYHALALLRDIRGDVYNVVIKSFQDNKDGFVVESVGPLVDNTPERINLPINQRRLQQLPFSGNFLAGAKGKPVLVPYPYPMNQIFYQYGDDPETAIFQSIHTGRIGHGLKEILDAVDEGIRHLSTGMGEFERPPRDRQ